MEQAFFNPMQHFAAGRQMGEQQVGQNLLRQYGAAAMQGDQNAVNALAANPYTMDVALGHMDRQQRQQNLDRDFGMQQQRLAISQEQLAMARDQARAEAERYAAAGRADEAAKEAALTETYIGNLGAAYASGNQQMFAQIAANPPAGLEDMKGVSWETFPATASVVGASLEGVLEALQGPKDKFRPATPEEAAQYGAQAGQVGPDGRFYPNNPPKGMEITSDGRGGFTLREGAGVGGQPAEFSPSSTSGMIASIDGILNDPALPYATGLAAPFGRVPGTDARRVSARMDQLDGQAFLQAFESLKGGGQITELEGQKATQAIGRLDRYQSPEDYKAALTELRELLILGSQRPKGWAEQRAKAQATPEIGTIDSGFRFLGGDPADPASWEYVKQ